MSQFSDNYYNNLIPNVKSRSEKNADFKTGYN